ncbi:hypothetical protein C8J55DRAFT_491840 [Lentinula edodes]|uniref:Uncharacterized protein n=1 Tax=Lentinula lateritia TaxID=40482 RepID=A0A9W9A0U3_9AGAR|nr:hypothetical protein C8J55DRAFT_491840 [Lentinula edodes]
MFRHHKESTSNATPTVIVSLPESQSSDGPTVATGRMPPSMAGSDTGTPSVNSSAFGHGTHTAPSSGPPSLSNQSSQLKPTPSVNTTTLDGDHTMKRFKALDGTVRRQYPASTGGTGESASNNIEAGSKKRKAPDNGPDSGTGIRENSQPQLAHPATYSHLNMSTPSNNLPSRSSPLPPIAYPQRDISTPPATNLLYPNAVAHAGPSSNFYHPPAAGSYSHQNPSAPSTPSDESRHFNCVACTPTVNYFMSLRLYIENSLKIRKVVRSRSSLGVGTFIIEDTLVLRSMDAVEMNKGLDNVTVCVSAGCT